MKNEVEGRESQPPEREHWLGQSHQDELPLPWLSTVPVPLRMLAGLGQSWESLRGRAGRKDLKGKNSSLLLRSDLSLDPRQGFHGKLWI